MLDSFDGKIIGLAAVAISYLLTMMVMREHEHAYHPVEVKQEQICTTHIDKN